jgi:hypothetical protein
MGTVMGRRGVAKVSVLLAALVLTGCGGGGDSDGGDTSTSETASRDTAAIVTVPNVLGLDDACKNTLDLISVSAQMISGQVAPDVARDTIERFQGNVPDEIAADAAVVVEVYLALIDAIEKSGGNIAAAISNPETMAVLERMDSAAVNEAGERLNAFLADECNLGNR